MTLFISPYFYILYDYQNNIEYCPNVYQIILLNYILKHF